MDRSSHAMFPLPHEALPPLDKAALTTKDRTSAYALAEERNGFFSAYETVDETYEQQREWELREPGQYLLHVKELSRSLPHLKYLAHWMEVSTAPPKWRSLKYDPDSRVERASRVKVSIIDYEKQKPATSTQCTTDDELRNALKFASNQAHLVARLLVCEDLSRDLVETLGSFYDIDPLFFISHVGDHLFHITRDRWIEVPNAESHGPSYHLYLQYLRARYFSTEQEFAEAECQHETFNVLRRLDHDRSLRSLQNGTTETPGVSVAISRAKTSLWIKPRTEGEPVTAILLVDPTVTPGHPLWGGYRPLEQTPVLKTWQTDVDVTLDEARRKSLFEDVVYWSSMLSPGDLSYIQSDPKSIALPMFRLVVADWLVVLKYMTTMLSQFEWQFEKPHWGETPSDIDHLLRTLLPLRRDASNYLAMVNDNIARLFPANNTASSTPYLSGDQKYTGILELWNDFRNIRQQLNEIQSRIRSIETLATNTINLEESRRSLRQAKNMARLTTLSVIFIPLSFVSSFFSMSPGFSSEINNFGIFVMIAIPLTLVTLLVLYWVQTQQRR